LGDITHDGVVVFGQWERDVPVPGQRRRLTRRRTSHEDQAQG
jgi:hypothetical protein